MAEEIVIRLSAEGNARLEIGKVEKQLKDLDSQVKQTGSTFKSVFETAAGVAIGQGLVKGLGLAIGAIQDFSRVLLSDSVRAAQEQEDALNRLNRSLALTGDFSADTSKEMENFADALSRTSTVGDEVILNQLAIAKAFGATNEQAKQLVQAAVNLSSITGQDLDSAVKSLGGSLQGVAGQLGKTIPGIKELTQEQLRAGDAIKLVADRFKGAAEGELQTFSGATKFLSNVFGELQESIGSLVTNNPAFVSAIQESARILDDLKSFIDANAISIRTNLTIALLAAADVAVFFIASLEGVFGLLAKIPGVGKAFEDARSGIEELGVSLERIRQSGENSLTDVAAGAKASKDPVNQLTNSINELTEAQKKSAAAGVELAKSLGFGEGVSAADKLKAETAALQAERDAQLITDEQFFARQSELRLQAFSLEQEQLKLAAETNTTIKKQFNDIELANQQKLAADLNAVNKSRTEFEKKQAEQRAAAQRESLNTIATLQSSNNKTLFRVGQAAALATATIDGIASIQKTAAAFPFPFNIPFVAAATAAQAANIAKIASAKPPGLAGGIDEVPPGFQNDTFAARLSSGERVVPAKTNEDLKEFLVENRGTNALLSQLIDAVKSSGSVMVNVGGETITNVVRRELESGGTLMVES